MHPIISIAVFFQNTKCIKTMPVAGVLLQSTVLFLTIFSAFRNWFSVIPSPDSAGIEKYCSFTKIRRIFSASHAYLFIFTRFIHENVYLIFPILFLLRNILKKPAFHTIAPLRNNDCIPRASHPVRSALSANSADSASFPKQKEA